MRILFTGGGSGGHLFPLIAVARQLKQIAQQKNLSLEMFYLGPVDQMTQVLVAEGIEIAKTKKGKIRRYPSSQNVLDLLKMPLIFGQSLWTIFRLMPDVVFSKGGFGSFWPVVASWIFRIPIVIHESDSVAGLANRKTKMLATRIAISFSEAAQYFKSSKTALIGHPVRQTICQGQRETARQYFKFNSDKPVILILGGSQGAQALNEISLGTAPALLQKYELILITGADKFESLKERGVFPAEAKIFPFLDEAAMSQAFGAADLVVARAGGGTIFEIAACAKPSILIPLPKSASDHQRINAFSYAKTGGCSVLKQVNLSPNLFLKEINLIMDNPQLRERMISGAKQFARPQAAALLAQELIELSKE